MGKYKEKGKGKGKGKDKGKGKGKGRGKGNGGRAEGRPIATNGSTSGGNPLEGFIGAVMGARAATERMGGTACPRGVRADSCRARSRCKRKMCIFFQRTRGVSFEGTIVDRTYFGGTFFAGRPYFFNDVP